MREARELFLCNVNVCVVVLSPAGLFQHLDYLLALEIHGKFHRRCTFVVSFVDISAVREQQGDATLVSEVNREVEWDQAGIVSGFHVCARLDKLRDD